MRFKLVPHIDILSLKTNFYFISTTISKYSLTNILLLLSTFNFFKIHNTLIFFSPKHDFISNFGLKPKIVFEFNIPMDAGGMKLDFRDNNTNVLINLHEDKGY